MKPIKEYNYHFILHPLMENLPPFLFRPLLTHLRLSSLDYIFNMRSPAACKILLHSTYTTFHSISLIFTYTCFLNKNTQCAISNISYIFIRHIPFWCKNLFSFTIVAFASRSLRWNHLLIYFLSLRDALQTVSKVFAVWYKNRWNFHWKDVTICWVRRSW